MHCYVCKQHSTTVMAIAICQRCGGAVCEAHSSLVRHPGAPGGMMGLVKPRVEHVCEPCLRESHVQAPSLPGHSRQQSESLPDALSVVQSVEALLLKNQRTFTSTKWSQFWQAISLRLARWFRWSKKDQQQGLSHASPATTSSSER